MPDAVQLTDLVKVFKSISLRARRETRAVDGLSLNIPQGEIFGLLGPNGAGKTTTIKILAGVVVADSGKVAFPAWPGRRPRVGAVMEGSRNLYWRLSVWENIRYFGEIKGVAMGQLRRQADDLLALFGIADKRNAPAQTLSRGQQQKLAVVLAFLGEPELLLLDEPTLGLDVASSLAIQGRLRDLCQQRGLSIIVTTHQMDVAQSLCKRVGIMREGKVAACALVADLVDHFKRQDYLLRMSTPDWERVRPAVAAYSHELLDEDRPGQVALRFKLTGAQELYPLMALFAAEQAELLDFRQDVPTLEEIFVSITGAGGEA